MKAKLLKEYKNTLEAAVQLSEKLKYLSAGQGQIANLCLRQKNILDAAIVAAEDIYPLPKNIDDEAITKDVVDEQKLKSTIQHLQRMLDIMNPLHRMNVGFALLVIGVLCLMSSFSMKMLMLAKVITLTLAPTIAFIGLLVMAMVFMLVAGVVMERASKLLESNAVIKELNTEKTMIEALVTTGKSEPVITHSIQQTGTVEQVYSSPVGVVVSGDPTSAPSFQQTEKFTPGENRIV